MKADCVIDVPPARQTEEVTISRFFFCFLFFVCFIYLLFFWVPADSSHFRFRLPEEVNSLCFPNAQERNQLSNGMVGDMQVDYLLQPTAHIRKSKYLWWNCETDSSFKMKHKSARSRKLASSWDAFCFKGKQETTEQDRNKMVPQRSKRIGNSRQLNWQRSNFSLRIRNSRCIGLLEDSRIPRTEMSVLHGESPKTACLKSGDCAGVFWAISLNVSSSPGLFHVNLKKWPVSGSDRSTMFWSTNFNLWNSWGMKHSSCRYGSSGIWSYLCCLMAKCNAASLRLCSCCVALPCVNKYLGNKSFVAKSADVASE